MNILKNNKEIVFYLIFGILTTIVSLAVYYALIYTILDANVAVELQLANIISWVISVAFAYITNHLFVFNNEENLNMKNCLKFYMSRLFTLVIDMILMYLLVSICAFNDKVIKLFVQIVVILLNYILSKFIIFKKNKKV